MQIEECSVIVKSDARDVISTTIIYHSTGEQSRIFLDYVESGAKFIYGENFRDHLFAMKVSCFE